MKKCFLIAIAITAFFATHAQQWTIKTPMPTPRISPIAVALNNLIYVIGGSNASGTLNLVEVYDPLLNTWSVKAPMLTGRTELAGAVVNGKIYVMGGFNLTGLNSVEEYNPATNTWTYKAPMPTARAQVSAAVINGKIYAVAGWPNENALEEYNPMTDTWVSKAPIAIAKQQINGAAAVNNQLYFMGGKDYGNTTFYTTNESYNPLTNVWTSKMNLPQSRFAGAAVSSGNQIHYLGGSDALYTPNYNQHFVYDASTDSWSTGVAMPNKRSRLAAVVLNGHMYAIGGMDSNSVETAWNQEFSLPTGITATSLTDGLNLSPNPASGKMELQFQGKAGSPATARLYNMTGTMIREIPITSSSTMVDCGGWPRGIYFLKVQQDDQLITRKIVLE